MEKTSEQKFREIGRLAFDLSAELMKSGAKLEDYAYLHRLSMAGREAAHDLKHGKIQTNEDEKV